MCAWCWGCGPDASGRVFYMDDAKTTPVDDNPAHVKRVAQRYMNLRKRIRVRAVAPSARVGAAGG